MFGLQWRKAWTSSSITSSRRSPSPACKVCMTRAFLFDPASCYVSNRLVRFLFAQQPLQQTIVVCWLHVVVLADGINSALASFGVRISRRTLSSCIRPAVDQPQELAVPTSNVSCSPFTRSKKVIMDPARDSSSTSWAIHYMRSFGTG